MTHARTYLLGTVVMLGVAVAAPCHATAQVRRFDVPAQTASTGIPQFAHQAGIQIMAPADVTDGLSIRRVQGTLEVTTALRRFAA